MSNSPSSGSNRPHATNSQNEHVDLAQGPRNARVNLARNYTGVRFTNPPTLTDPRRSAPNDSENDRVGSTQVRQSVRVDLTPFHTRIPSNLSPPASPFGNIRHRRTRSLRDSPLSNPALAAAFSSGRRDPDNLPAPAHFQNIQPGMTAYGVPIPADAHPADREMMKFAGTEGVPIRPDVRDIPDRTKAIRACDQCNAGKKNCGGRSPVCVKCEGLKIKCTWNRVAGKRGPITGYGKGVEKLMGMAMEGGLQDRFLELWHNTMPTPEDKKMFIRAWNKDSKDNELEKLWRDSDMHKEFRSFLEEVIGDDPVQPKKARRQGSHGGRGSFSVPTSHGQSYVPPGLAPPRPTQASASLVGYRPVSPDLSEFVDHNEDDESNDPEEYHYDA